MAKIFRGKDTTLLYSQLKIFFEKVSIAKPASSRNSSIEAFVVCQNYQPPAGYIPQMINPMNDDVVLVEEGDEWRVNRLVIPFVVCGDLRGFDSDMSYSLEVRTFGQSRFTLQTSIIVFNFICAHRTYRAKRTHTTRWSRNPFRLPTRRFSKKPRTCRCATSRSSL